MSKLRLACTYCDTTDGDGIKSLKTAELAGWQDIKREQTYGQACKTYEPNDTPPAGYSGFDWFTNLGTCPECADEFEKGEERRKANQDAALQSV